jgi:hypothetical protein
MLDQFQTRQQILFDLTANFLGPLNDVYQRLAYLSDLREATDGRYVHAELASVYGAEAVDQVVAECHEEVFERLLEMPLNSQAAELRSYLSSLPGTWEENVSHCREKCRDWVPLKAPGYLKELYESNLDVLLELLLEDTSKARPSS